MEICYGDARMDVKLADRLFTETEQGYDRIAGHFSSTRQAPWAEVQNLIDQYVQPGQEILDVGCGNGRVADLSDKIKAHYTGVDLSSALIGIARVQHPDATFHVSNMMHTPFADNQFDHVLLIASFHHVPSREYRLATLTEMKRIVKPGGMIMMTNWNKYQVRFIRLRMQFLWNLLTEKTRMDYGDVLVPWRNQTGTSLADRYYHLFTARELTGLAKKADLNVIDQYYETQGTRKTKHGAANIVTVLQKPETENAG
jgi:ubiquinone/menaquinone biosynthesis C-methylase UbiE